MVASEIEKLIDPTVANGITASLFAFFTIGFLMHPYQMARGTVWPKGEGWFKEGTLPTAREGPMYQVMRFFAIAQLSTFVVPAIIEPHSQYLTYFSCIVIFLQMIHQIVAMSGLVKVYKDVIPDTKGGKIQIAVGMTMSLAVLVYYYFLVSQPLSLLRFAFSWNSLWCVNQNRGGGDAARARTTAPG